MRTDTHEVALAAETDHYLTCGKFLRFMVDVRFARGDIHGNLHISPTINDRVVTNTIWDIWPVKSDIMRLMPVIAPYTANGLKLIADCNVIIRLFIDVDDDLPMDIPPPELDATAQVAPTFGPSKAVLEARSRLLRVEAEARQLDAALRRQAAQVKSKRAAVKRRRANGESLLTPKGQRRVRTEEDK